MSSSRFSRENLGRKAKGSPSKSNRPGGGRGAEAQTGSSGRRQGGGHGSRNPGGDRRRQPGFKARGSGASPPKKKAAWSGGSAGQGEKPSFASNLREVEVLTKQLQGHLLALNKIGPLTPEQACSRSLLPPALFCGLWCFALPAPLDCLVLVLLFFPSVSTLPLFVNL